MDATMASPIRACKMARDAHPQRDALERLHLVLPRAVGFTRPGTTFTAWLTIDSFIAAFVAVTSKVDDLVACLQAMRGDASLAEARFLALRFLEYPSARPVMVYLEVALVAQRLLQHFDLQHFIDHLEHSIFKASITYAAYEGRMATFLRRKATLKKIVRKNIALAAATSRVSNGQASS